MIVNEKGERIEKLQIMNPEFIEGKGLGEGEYDKSPAHINIAFMTEYREDFPAEIEIVFLEKNYPTAHKLKLKETGNDTRIFKSYDYAENVELKINHPSPYPTIIITSREDEQAKIEYIKLNDNILNDLNGDGVIQNDEIIKLPILKSPDYSNLSPEEILSTKRISEINYLLSNISSSDEISNHEQIDYVPENYKFYVKIKPSEINRNGSDTIIAYIPIENMKEKIILFKKDDSYYSDAIVLVNSFNSKYIEKEGDDYYFNYGSKFPKTRIIKPEKYQGTLEIEYKNFKTLKELEIFFSLVIKNFRETPSNDVMLTARDVSKLGYQTITDLSGEIKTLKYMLNNFNMKVVYYCGHGGIIGQGEETPFLLLKKDLKTIDEVVVFPKDIENEINDNTVTLLVLDACLLGKHAQILKDAFNAKMIIAFKEPINEHWTSSFFGTVFRNLKKYLLYKKIFLDEIKINELNNIIINPLELNLILNEKLFEDYYDIVHLTNWQDYIVID